MYKYILLISLIFLTGCSIKSMNDKIDIEENETNKKYVNISKDAIFEAAKKVFLLASEKEFRIDSYRNQLIISKTKMSHYPLYAVTHEDFINLSIEEENSTSTVKLNVYRITDYDNENPKYYSKDFHKILFNRIDYLLGLNDKWEKCRFHIRPENELLCDSVDMSNAKMPSEEDIIKNILIVDRKVSKTLNDIHEDILEQDIDLSIEDSEDLLKKEDTLDTNEETNDENKSSEDSFDKEIEELERKVNKNIDETLDKIEKEEDTNKVKDSIE